MTTTNTFAATQRSFRVGAQTSGRYFSLPELAKTYPNVNRLPVSLRIVLESVLRNCDGKKVTEAHVHQLANWQPNAPRVDEIPFVVARVSGCMRGSGWRGASEAMMPPSFISTLAVSNPP